MTMHTKPAMAIQFAVRREVFYVESGSLRVFTGADSVLLQAGDSAQLAMDTEHHFANEGRGVAHFILLVATPTHGG